MDSLSKERRSWNMAQIRSKDTSPEKAVRSAIHRMGLRFRLHRADLPGRPDLVLPRYRIALFVNGCFWHRHPNCRFAYTPKTRTAFWEKKFRDNVSRDMSAREALRKAGWRCVTIWECQTKKAGLEQRLSTALKRYTRRVRDMS